MSVLVTKRRQAAALQNHANFAPSQPQRRSMREVTKRKSKTE